MAPPLCAITSVPELTHDAANEEFVIAALRFHRIDPPYSRSATRSLPIR